MSTHPDANAQEPEGLPSDHEEYDNAANTVPIITCAGCRQPIVDHYYESNGTTLCESCRVLVERQFKGGSGFFRLVKATFFGSLAAIVGAAVYFAILHLFNYQLALVSILCGFLIGKGVRIGSEDRGGWIYQILAIMLTYFAISSAITAAALASGEVDTEIAKMAVDDPQNAPVDETGKLILKIVIALFYLIAGPIVISIAAPISALIILFALWEAWKFTKKAKFVMNGPFAVPEPAPEYDEIDEVEDHP